MRQTFSSRHLRKAVFGLVFLLVGGVLWRATAGERIDHAGAEEKLCVVKDQELTEASGMALSHEHPGFLWLHNDSGDAARLFLIDRSGETHAIVTLNGVTAYDWEDMCSFRIGDANWLLVGDVGDNARARKQGNRVCTLLLFREPKMQLDRDAADRQKIKAQKLNLDVHATVQVTYPDGPCDCESIAVDSERHEILFVSKSDPLNCRLFRTPLKLEPGLQKVKLESIGSPGVLYATAMDISSDGRRMVIGSMFMGALIERQPDESWESAFIRGATSLKLPARRQGETICFDEDDGFLLAGSEGVGQPIWRVPVNQTAPESKEAE